MLAELERDLEENLYLLPATKTKNFLIAPSLGKNQYFCVHLYGEAQNKFPNQGSRHHGMLGDSHLALGRETTHQHAMQQSLIVIKSLIVKTR